MNLFRRLALGEKQRQPFSRQIVRTPQRAIEQSSRVGLRDVFVEKCRADAGDNDDISIQLSYVMTSGKAPPYVVARHYPSTWAPACDFLPTLFGAIRVGCAPVERHRSD
jgi:hypothetical protein